MVLTLKHRIPSDIRNNRVIGKRILEVAVLKIS